jgi:hypothetical protein
MEQREKDAFTTWARIECAKRIDRDPMSYLELTNKVVQERVIEVAWSIHVEDGKDERESLNEALRIRGLG